MKDVFIFARLTIHRKIKIQKSWNFDLVFWLVHWQFRL